MKSFSEHEEWLADEEARKTAKKKKAEKTPTPPGAARRDTEDARPGFDPNMGW